MTAAPQRPVGDVSPARPTVPMLAAVDGPRAYSYAEFHCRLWSAVRAAGEARTTDHARMLATAEAHLVAAESMLHAFKGTRQEPARRAQVEKAHAELEIVRAAQAFAAAIDAAPGVREYLEETSRLRRVKEAERDERVRAVEGGA